MPAGGRVISVLVGAIAVLVCTHADYGWLLQHPIGDARASQWDVMYHLGGNSPWLRKVTNTSGDIPEGCVIDQVHMMSRHAERYPTFNSGEKMLELYQRLQHLDIKLNGSLSFVNEWDFFAPFPNEQFEQLTNMGPYAGTMQSFRTGVNLRTRYERLLHSALAKNQTNFWSCDSKRDIETARYFATGFFGLDWENCATLHIVPETTTVGADTLTPGRACPNYATDPRGHSFGVSNLMTFRSSYVPNIIQRLQEDNPGIIFTEAEVYAMQEMCGFELLAKGHTKWCNVFTRDEILKFEYARDLLHYYRAGPGNLFGPSMGWLWLNATANLLRRGPDAGPMFLSFNHDGDMIAMLAALDLLPQTPHLPATHVLDDRTWRTSDVTPMSARIIFERLACAAAQTCWTHEEYGYPNHIYCDPPRNETYIRIDVNDGIVPLHDCKSGPGQSCPLEDFVKRVTKRGEALPEYADLCGLADHVPKELTFLHQ